MQTNHFNQSTVGNFKTSAQMDSFLNTNSPKLTALFNSVPKKLLAFDQCMQYSAGQNDEFGQADYVEFDQFHDWGWGDL